MILDSGAVTICGVSSTEGEGPSPVYTMVPKLTAPFGEKRRAVQNDGERLTLRGAAEDGSGEFLHISIAFV